MINKKAAYVTAGIVGSVTTAIGIGAAYEVAGYVMLGLLAVIAIAFVSLTMYTVLKDIL